MTPTQMAAHVAELAEKHNIRVIYVQMDLRYSCADAVTREVYVPPITDGAVYAAVLHEMGHVAHPRGVLCNRRDASTEVKLREEQNAWAWAKYVALEWSPLMEESYQYAISTYTRARDHSRVLNSDLAAVITAILDMTGRDLDPKDVTILKPGRKP